MTTETEAAAPSRELRERLREVRGTAREALGLNTLRPEQERAVQSLLDGSDVLAVMPTGWGKSAIYQLAALLLDGPTVVLSPLIALQRDQIRSLEETEAPDAVAVNSQVGTAATERAWDQLRSGTAEYVFLTPEQLSNDDVLQRLKEVRPSLLVVDEAHCVSSWGHDFRPDYLRIGDVLAQVGRPRVLALTATASPPVRAEIVERLRMDPAQQIVGGFDRPNLHLGVRLFADAHAKETALLDAVASRSGAGLVYVGKRKDAQAYAARLVERGVRAAAFHAGLKASERDRVHRDFLGGAVDVVVATSAFGMGIDKPDVRFVLHAHISESIDAYYQEVGRGGRDGEPAEAVLFYRAEDLGLRRFFASGGFDEVTVRRVASALLEGPATLAEMEQRLGLKHRRAAGAVSLLQQAGAVSVDDERRLHWTGPVSARDAAEQAAHVAEAVVAVGRSRLEMMRGYAETTECRRRFLLGYFGEHLPAACGRCDLCDSRAASASQQAGDGVADGAAEEVDRVGKEAPFPLNARVTHRTWGPGIVMHPEPDRVTVLFEQVGYKTLALELLEREPLLTLDGD